MTVFSKNFSNLSMCALPESFRNLRSLYASHTIRAYLRSRFSESKRDEVDLPHFEIFNKYFARLSAFRVQRKTKFVRPTICNYLQPIDIEQLYRSNACTYEDGNIILPNGRQVLANDYEGILEAIKKLKPPRYNVKQSGAESLITSLTDKYTTQLRMALVASKVAKVVTYLNCAQLSLCVVQLIVCIMNITTFGNSFGKLASLMIAIGQVMLAIAAVISQGYILKNGGVILEAITTLAKEYLGDTNSNTEKQFSMPTVEIVLSAICGIIGIGVSGACMFDIGWANNFSKNLIHGDKFRQCLKSTVKDTREFVEEVSETCFNIKLSPLAKTFDEVKDISDQVSSWLQKPDSYLVAHPRELSKFAVCLSSAENIYTSFKVRASTLESRYANALNLLFQNIIVARGRLDHLRRLRQQERVKQEPPCFNFVGRPGAGKTTFINTYLIPEIQKRMGWPAEKYVVDFGGQPEFWPPYLGEPIAFFDEFLAMKSKDPVVPHLNRICSTEHNIIPGANTYTKEQECLFKVFILGSNVHYQSFGDVLATESERAMYSRLTRFEVINSTCPPEDIYDRTVISHSKTFEELEFRRYLKPPHQKSTNARCLTKKGTNTRATRDPYVVVTKEEILEEIIDRILEKEQEYLRFMAQDEEAPKDSLGNYVSSSPKVLEQRPNIQNLLNPKEKIQKKVKKTTPRTIVAKLNEEDYTVETLEQYIDAVFRSIASGDPSMDAKAISRFLGHLECIIISDVCVLESIFDKCKPLLEGMAGNVHFTPENKIRTVRLFAKYKRTLKLDCIVAPTTVPTPEKLGITARIMTKKSPWTYPAKMLSAVEEETAVEEIIEEADEELEEQISTTTEDDVARLLDIDIPDQQEEQEVEEDWTELEELLGTSSEVTEALKQFPPITFEVDAVENVISSWCEELIMITDEIEANKEFEVGKRGKIPGYLSWTQLNAVARDMLEVINSDDFPQQHLEQCSKKFLEQYEYIHPVVWTYPIMGDVYNTFVPTEKQVGDVVEHLVAYIHGPPGTGKSTMAEHVGIELAKMFAMPLVSVKLQSLTAVQILQPSVIVLHDKNLHEEAYSQWYDTLPHGCIILNTSNIAAHQVKGIKAYLRRSTSHYTIDSAKQIPGYARRSGLPGYIYHAKQWAYVTPALREEIEVSQFGKYVVEGKILLLKDIVVRLADKFVPMAAESGKVEVIREESFSDSFIGDLTLRADSLDTLKEAVQSAPRMFAAYAKPSPQMSISVSNEILNTNYIFNVTDFVLPEVKDNSGITEVAIKTYSLLRRGGRELRAHIITPEIEIRCSEGKIRYTTTVAQPSLAYSVRKEYDDTYIYVQSVDEGMMQDVGKYSAGSIMSGFAYGFQSLYPSMPTYDHIQFLLSRKEELMAHPDLLPYKVVVTPICINAAVVSDQYDQYQQLWKSFSESKPYKVLVIVGVVFFTIASLLIMWEIGAYLVGLFGGSADKRKCPEFILVKGKKYAITPTESGNMIHYAVTPPSGEELDLENITPVLETITTITYGEKYNLGSIAGVVQQFGSLNAHDKKEKKPAVKSTRIVASAKQSMLDNAGHTAVREKVLSAQVVVQHGSYRMYGLRWKERDILFPAHLLTTKERIVNVSLPVNVGGGSYAVMQVPAMTYHVDFPNDIAVARIHDKTVPASKDITKYFHRERQMYGLSEALLMKRAGTVNELTFVTANAELFAGNVSIVKHNGKSVSDTPNTALEFYLAQYRSIPTKAGDCGSPYVSMDAANNTAMIIGLHTDRDIGGKRTWGNVISQEYLAQVKSIAETEKQADISLINIPFENIAHPRFAPESKQWIVEPEYFDALTGLEEDTNADIFYDAEINPDSELLFIGYEKKHRKSWAGKPSHKPVPWQSELSTVQQELAPLIDKRGYLSLTDARNHPDPSSLCHLKDQPSLIATEINMYSDPIPWDSQHEELLAKALPLYTAKIDADYGREFRVLTNAEVINGLWFEKDNFYGHLDAMDLDTSAGDYPRRLFNITQKRILFEKVPSSLDRDVYDWKTTDEAQAVRASCVFAEQSALRGTRVVYPATDALKYELQSKPNKSRCFQCLSIQDVLLMRRYSGALQSIVAQRHLDGTCSVGIDPVVGFQQLIHRFRKISQFGEAGDFKRWDKHMLAPLIKVVLRDICQRYIDTDPENAEELTNVYNVIIDIIVYTLSIADGHWYIKMRGNPSGNVLTAVMNSFINLLMTYMGIVYIIDEHNKFLETASDHDLVKKYGTEHRSKVPVMKRRIESYSQWIQKYFDCVFYGDDKLSVIHPDYLWLVNFHSFRNFYTQILGIDYDTPNKDGNYIAFDDITNLSYLSRQFREQQGTILPCLKRETVNAFLYWARENNPAQWKDLLDAALHEAILHPREYYEQLRKVVLWILEWSRKHQRPIEYVPPTYEALLQETVVIIRNGRSPGPLISASGQSVVQKVEILGKPCAIVSANRICDIITNVIPESTKQSYKSPGCIDCFENKEKERVMGQKQSSPQVTTMSVDDVYDDLVAIHNQLVAVFQDWKGDFLKQYHPFPALVRSAAGNVISVGFTAPNYDLSNAGRVQSDLAKYVQVQVGLQMKVITVCERILGPHATTATPIWQVQFTHLPTTPSSRLTATRFVLNETARNVSLKQSGKIPEKDKKSPSSTSKVEQCTKNWASVDPLTIGASLKGVYEMSKVKKDNTKQSTGTAAMGMVEEHVAENDADVTMPVTQGVARGVLTKAPIWHLNLAQTVTQYRETADSPLRVAMGTAVHTVIDKISYGDVSNMPTCMRWWAYSHESGAPTIWVEYKFISAATIVNQLIVGIADSNKSTYSMEELQQIEGVVINPQEGTIAVPLKLAATSLTNEAPTRITLSQTAITGTDAAPVNIPTLVILTATAIQNAYANDDVQVNIRKKAKFGALSEPWFVTSRSLTTMKSLLAPTSGMRAAVSSFVSLSTALGLPVGYPMYVTADGAYLQDHQQLPDRVSIDKSLPILDATSNLGGVSQELLMTSIQQTLNIRLASACTSTGGCIWSTEAYADSTVTSFATILRGLSSGNDTITNMKALFSTSNPVFVPAWTVMLFGQGENPIPSSVNTVLNPGVGWTVDNVKSQVLDVWIAGIDKDYSYTISELAVPQSVNIYYHRQEQQVTAYGAFDYASTSLVAYTSGLSADATGGYDIRPYRTFEITHVIEFAHPSQGASTVYAGFTNEGFVGNASAGAVQFPGSISGAFTRMTGFNLETLSVVQMQNMEEAQAAVALARVEYKPLRGVLQTTDISGQPARVVEVLSKAVSTLGSTMSRLVFSNTLPKTVPATIASGQGAVEVRDDYCYQQLRLYIQRLGMSLSDDQVLTFQLYMRSGIRVVATVVFDLATNEMYIVNNPSVDADRYKTLRKLTAEDLYIGNFQAVAKASNVIDATDTRNWIDRTVADDSVGVYTGSLITKLKVTKIAKERTSQAEAMLPLLMAGQQGGNFMQMLLQYYMLKGQMNLQQQQKLEQIEKEFQMKMQLQENQQAWKEKMAGLGNPLAQTAAITSAASQRPGIGFVPGSSTSNDAVGGEAPLINLDSTVGNSDQTDTFDQQISRFREMLNNTAGLSSGADEIVGHQLSDAEAPGRSQEFVLPTSQPSSVPTPDYVLSRSYKKGREALSDSFGIQSTPWKQFSTGPSSGIERSGNGLISVMPFTE